MTARDIVTTRLFDSAGRASPPAANGHYAVGHAGGVLSLSPKPGYMSAPVTMIVRYRRVEGAGRL